MRLGKRIVDRIRALVGRPAAYAAAEWRRMSPRERRLISILGGAFATCAFLLVAYLMIDSLQSMGQDNKDMRDALDAIAKHSGEYRDGKARAKAQELRIGSDPPQLAADLEAAAKEAGIQIPETADRPDAAAGKRYVEHSLDLKLRKVDLKSLATFLGKVETSRRLILITRLEIRRSFGGDGTSVDVDLTATTYERLKDGSKKPAGKGGPAAGKGKG
jgi:type II secretory pathway component PulM